ncbi:hypothetical protein [Neobacillus terrae]|uniref:hypothetical protein n=1 Tax=Neobacillus terrae TaxID=3034837 RepID=UPI00140842EF|nr:hypothetical protein [Neobacillus terrae]NHM29675.1 hypothetical protein [Neobacillus terrae]
MYKKIIICLLIFLAAFGGIQYWQWHSFSEIGKKHSDGLKNQVSQELIINSDASGLLNIVHTFSGLSTKKEYTVLPPRYSPNWTCIGADREKCASQDSDPNTFLATKGTLSLQYSLQTNKKEKAFLLMEWSAGLKNESIQNTKITIISPAKQKGKWIAGIPLTGLKKRELIDYYVFKGREPEVSLYWQESPLYVLKQTGNYTIYSDRPEELNTEKKIIESSWLKSMPFLNIFFTKKTPPGSAPGFLFLADGRPASEIQAAAAEYFYGQKFKKAPESEWIKDMLLSNYSGNEPRTEKGRFALNQLHSSLSDKEWKKFIGKVNRTKTQVNVRDLDSILEKTKGMKTSFFTLNAEKTNENIPLTFFESRSLVINGTKAPSLEILIAQSSHFYPFVATMGALGYTAGQREEKFIVLKKQKAIYSFQPEKKIFYRNGQSYGLLINPFMVKTGKVYISEAGLKSIFKVKVTETKKEITLID